MFFWINIVLILILVAFGGYELYIYIAGKRSATMIEEDEFKEGMRKAQVIDVREKDEFDAGHIMGARSYPYTLRNQAEPTFRKDKPIYIYDQRKALSARTANFLRKKGYTDIFILKDGYEGWSGKVKKKNS